MMRKMRLLKAPQTLQGQCFQNCDAVKMQTAPNNRILIIQILTAIEVPAVAATAPDGR